MHLSAKRQSAHQPRWSRKTARSGLILVSCLRALEVAATDPRHQAAQASPGLFDRVLFPGFEKPVIALHSGPALADPFPREFSVPDILQNGLHRLFRASIDDTGAADDVAIFCGFRNGKTHPGDSGFID